MTYLGIDFGLKKIGLAISDGILPLPLPTLTYNSQAEVLERLVRLCSENAVKKIVVGLPVPDKIGARKFGEKLKELAGIDLVFYDETLTTQDALKTISGKSKKTKKQEDSFAASQILADYLAAQS